MIRHFAWQLSVVLPVACLLLASCSRQPELPAINDIGLTYTDRPAGRLSDYRGKWLIVNFWSVGCPPCYEEMPDLDQLHKDGTEAGWQVLGISMPYDRPDSILQATRKLALSYPAAMDLQGEVSRTFGGIQMVPTTFLLNSEGLVVKKFTGKVSYQQLRETLEELMKTNGTRS
jgi:peroxiredoxin